MKTSHDVIESNKNPKRKLTGEAAIFEEENHFSPTKITAEFQSCSRNSARRNANTLLWRNSIAKCTKKEESRRRTLESMRKEKWLEMEADLVFVEMKA